MRELTRLSNVTRTPGTYRVNTPAGLNVRSGAGTHFALIGGLPNGTAITVTQVSGSRDGWVSLEFAVFQDGTPAAPKSPGNDRRWDAGNPF